MGKIALETEVYAIGGKGSPVSNKCSTKARAEALGCKIKSGYSYASNQLIEQGSYEKAITMYKGVSLEVAGGRYPALVWPFQYMTWPPNQGNATLAWYRQGNNGITHYYGVEVNSEDDDVYVNVGGTGETMLYSGNICEIGYYSGGNNAWSRQNKSIIVFTSEDLW